MSPPAASDTRQALAAALAFRLPFGRQAWRGAQGNWLGVGLGSSIDFQDHRAYAPGDDPRYIHWAAYARTGQLTMKLYRAEVAPLVDIVVDVSESMSFDPAKAARTEQLLAFCVHSADGAGAPVRVHVADGADVRALPLEWVRAGRWRERRPAAARRAGPAAIPGTLPWRPGALKVLVSDLLYPGEPAALLGPLAAGAGVGLVFAPAVADERELAPRGNVELVDCEGGARRRQRVDDDLAERYRTAYRRHFALWAEAARQRGVLLAPVAGEGSLRDALAGEPLRQGLVEHQV
ncbi:MAG TPA: DUF58 domain-containing protein [Opitutaceae bacterium]|nr:DUF58 domain-containing protein [Opitutaceae bacterium]